MRFGHFVRLRPLRIQATMIIFWTWVILASKLQGSQHSELSSAGYAIETAFSI